MNSNEAQNLQGDFDSSLESYDLGGLPVDVLKVCSKSCKNTPPQNLILVVPGNPGIVSYYSTFIQLLCEKLKDPSVSVWSISHSCHSLTEARKECLDSIRNDPLEVEIEHKLRFLEQVVPRECNVTLVGHSIGCFMILSVLEILSGLRNRCEFPYLASHSNRASTDQEKYKLLSRINKSYFLFPTVERMKDSPNGQRIWPILNYFQWVPIGLCAVIACLPIRFRNYIASLSLGPKCNDPSMVASTVQLLTPRMFGNMLNLAYHELLTVKDINTQSVGALREKLVFYYGASDRWCPLMYRNELLAAVPDVINYVDDQGVDHAFVVSHSRIIAEILVNIMRNS